MKLRDLLASKGKEDSIAKKLVESLLDKVVVYYYRYEALDVLDNPMSGEGVYPVFNTDPHWTIEAYLIERKKVCKFIQIEIMEYDMSKRTPEV